MFLNDNQHLYVYLYWGKCPFGHICPMIANNYRKIKKNLFKCILLQISHKNVFL